MINLFLSIIFILTFSTYGANHPQDVQEKKKIDLPLAFGEVSCQSCHRDHTRLKEKNALTKPYENLCITCHIDFNDKNLNHVNLKKESNSCRDCHDMHNSAGKKLLIIKHKNLCQSCHKKVKMTNHPGVRKDKKLLCTGCHKVHGGQKKLSYSKKNTCIECHDKFKTQSKTNKHLDLKLMKERFPWDKNENSCLHCHHPHKKKLGNNMCISCHKTKGRNHKKVKRLSFIAKARGLIIKNNETLRCTTCHDPHAGEGRYMLTNPKKIQTFCTACHGKDTEVYQKMHTRIKPKK